MTVVADLETLRASYHARVREIHAARNATNQAAKPCDHVWQKFRQTIIGDNPRFKGDAHFVLKGCAKCKRKHLLELVVSTTAGRAG